MHRPARFLPAEPPVPRVARPGAAERLSVNAGAVAVVAAVTALAFLVILAGKLLPIGRP